jgi:hypothetical protein
LTLWSNLYTFDSVFIIVEALIAYVPSPLNRKSLMKTVFRILVALPAILFVVMGLRWAVDPAGAAPSLGMTLMQGIGLSSQIADIGAFFIGMGTMMLIGLVTQTRAWFQAPALLLGLAAVLRVLSWLVHDAALALDMIIVEVLVATILIRASSRLSQDK